jgi:hypothetical protein
MEDLLKKAAIEKMVLIAAYKGYLFAIYTAKELKKWDMNAHVRYEVENFLEGKYVCDDFLSCMSVITDRLGVLT